MKRRRGQPRPIEGAEEDDLTDAERGEGEVMGFEAKDRQRHEECHEAGKCHRQQEGCGKAPAERGAENCRRIGPEAEEAALGERQGARNAKDELIADRKERVDARDREHAKRIGVALEYCVADEERCECESWGDLDRHRYLVAKRGLGFGPWGVRITWAGAVCAP